MANLGTILEFAPKRWPRLYRRTIVWCSIQRVPMRDQIDWNLNAPLCTVRIGEEAPQSVEVVEKDWAHISVEWKGDMGKYLRIWMARTTPAVLMRTNAEALSLFGAEGDPKPRFCAFEHKVGVRVASLAEGTELDLGGAAWMLVWFGEAFTSSRFPSYMAFHAGGVRVTSYPYPADCPLLLLFQNPPVSVSAKNGLQLVFPSGGAGYVVLLPLFGDSYPLARPISEDWLGKPYRISWRVFPAEFKGYCYPPDFETYSWERELPEKIIEACRWWADHLCEFPVSVRESYCYDPKGDVLTVVERFDFVRVREGGTFLAPLPPPLALAYGEDFPIEFDKKPVTTTVLTAHGPFMGVEGVRSYSWRLRGLSRYALPREEVAPKGRAPRELYEELEREVGKILDAGELAPWYPVLDDNGAGYMGFYDRGYRGHFVFGNPGETIYFLAEIYPLLRPETKRGVLEYLRRLRKAHPPEEGGFLLLGQGRPRERCRPTPRYIVERLNKNFLQANFYLGLGLVPEINLYYLARYYELTGDLTELRERWPKIRSILWSYLPDLDWGTMGFLRRPVPWQGREGLGGVIDINRLFAALVGAIRLARMAGDREVEELAWGLFGRAAVLRFALGKYYRYLYRNGLLRSPQENDWMLKLLAGSWHGYLYTARWKGPENDIQQVWQMDQFGVNFREDRLRAWPGLLFFLDGVPELGRFVGDFLRQEAEALMRRVEEVMPAWWTIYCPCEQTWETNFQPPKDSYQLFMLLAWTLDERPERLAWLRGVPWLERGDLFYLHKLAKTIKAFERGG